MGTEYKLTYEFWEQLGFPDVEQYVIDQDEDGNMTLLIDGTDNDNDGIPDLLEQLAGGDVILNPSQGVVIG